MEPVRLGSERSAASPRRLAPVGGSGPGLLWLGPAHAHDFAGRFAREGFVVHVTEPIGPPGGGHGAAADDSALDRRLSLGIEALFCDPAQRGSRIALAGLGFGGVLALRAATGSRRVAAVVDFEGCDARVSIDWSRFGAALFAAFGAEDPVRLQPEYARLESALRGLPAPSALRVEAEYPAGFLDPEQGDRYRAPAAAAVWWSALAFLRAVLR